MVIELYGLPASGKTTIVRRLAQEKEGRAVEIQSVREALFLFGTFFLRHPRAAVFLLRFYGKQRRAAGSIRHFYNTVVYRCAKWEKARREEKGESIFLLDEGLLQNLLSLPLRILEEREAARFIKNIPTGNCVITLALPERVRRTRHAARTAQRGKGNFSSPPEEVMKKNFSLSLSVLRNLPHVVVVSSEQEALQKIMALLKKRI